MSVTVDSPVEAAPTCATGVRRIYRRRPMHDAIWKTLD